MFDGKGARELLETFNIYTMKVFFSLSFKYFKSLKFKANTVTI